MTIIHATVAVGVSLGLGAVHSPIRGMHPNLYEGVKTFVKFFGGARAGEASEHFRRAGVKVMIFDRSDTTEALKLFDTLYYGVCVEYAKEVKRHCDDKGLNFSDVYRLANISYNLGYKELGHEEFVRPVLEPIMGKIGGHCILPNARLLNTPFANFILELNEKCQD